MADFTIPGAGNISESSTIKIDGIRPFVQSVEYNDASLADTFRLGQTVEILVTFSEPVELGGGGNLLVDLETGTPDGRVTISTIPESPDPDNNPLTVLGTYTVGVGEYTRFLAVKQILLSAGTLVDTIDNAFANYIISGAGISSASAIVIDGVVPSAFTITSVTSNGGNSETSDAVAYDDIWNSTNTSAIVGVPLEGEVVGHNTLVNGNIQVKGKITGSYVDVGSVHPITSAQATAEYAEAVPYTH